MTDLSIIVIILTGLLSPIIAIGFVSLMIYLDKKYNNPKNL